MPSDTWETNKGQARKFIGLFVILCSIPFIPIGVGLGGVYLGWKIYQSGKFWKQKQTTEQMPGDPDGGGDG